MPQTELPILLSLLINFNANFLQLNIGLKISAAHLVIYNFKDTSDCLLTLILVCKNN